MRLRLVNGVNWIQRNRHTDICNDTDQLISSDQLVTMTKNNQKNGEGRNLNPPNPPNPVPPIQVNNTSKFLNPWLLEFNMYKYYSFWFSSHIFLNESIRLVHLHYQRFLDSNNWTRPNQNFRKNPFKVWH